MLHRVNRKHILFTVQPIVSVVYLFNIGVDYFTDGYDGRIMFNSNTRYIFSMNNSFSSTFKSL